jgi:PAS domain S-box-containing protein
LPGRLTAAGHFIWRFRHPELDLPDRQCITGGMMRRSDANDAASSFLRGSGEMSDLIARHDWAATPLGPMAEWSMPMRSVLAFVLRSPVPIVTLWGDAGVMIYNDAYRGFAGEGHPAMLGSEVLTGWPEVAHLNIEVMAKVYRDGGTLSFRDHELTRERDGAPRPLWVDLEYSPALDDDGVPIGVVAVVVETTAKVVASRRLQDDRNRLWAISQDLLMVCTLGGTITAVNPSATRMLGWAEEEMVGRSVRDFVHPDDLTPTSTEIERLNKGLSTLQFENRYRTRGGNYRLLAWTAVPGAGRIHAVGRDITEERRLALDRERMWRLSPIIQLITDAGGVILDANPTWTQVMGWTREETIGRRGADFIAENADASDDRLSVLNAGATLPDYRTVFRTKGGERRLINWTSMGEGGTVYGFGRDVTLQEGTTAALAEAEEALRQSQKMEAVGQLTGGIAHDFNNLLQGISGSLEIVERRVSQGRFDALDRFISGASAAAGRAAALTHRLLAFSRRQPLDPKPVAVNALVESMADLLRRTIGENVALDLALDDALWVVRCDPNQLENAILNLAINARDAMPDGGRLTIATANAPLDGAYAAREHGVAPGQYVRVSVTDTGRGMDEATMARAFEPFFTTKPIGEGTGLGLSMIYGFAKQSEGYATIASVPGEGSTFTVYLPRHRDADAPVEEPAGAAPPPAVAPNPPRDGNVVLVVEDEAVVRGLIVEELEELGYRTLEAADGLAGLEILRSAVAIDLLLTDIGLPGLNGHQMAEAARLTRPDLKVIFMTGYAENAALASGFMEPGMALLTKPFTMETLATRLGAMLSPAGQDGSGR